MAEAFRCETDRLVLRDWRGDADWAEFFRVTNTPAVMEWLGGVLGVDGMAMQRGRVEQCAARNGFCFWPVERKADGALLGFCGLKRADAPGSTVTGAIEIGWRLREDAWGHGYAKEAAQAALALAFERFGAEEVVALTVEGNSASWGLMKRLWMGRRADLDYADHRYDPPWRDTIVYSVDRPTWESRP
ncbi:GNAT family N-acetyltransferase [Altererythrobacter sp. H2]|uniref:GNAT family N-acetyltransferase n=1 Tax=Altererythrobacter sp. H2 TaxID=3108391 RepID=UPI000BCB48FC|nr:GNAT family N-acetyltransferase [Altererythrobacter sp. H2]OZA94618.1 MAG: GNAT family N-acetyltransferase [Erythrobacter sp. 34-65-8]WRK96027.1 GNAT family N-acetyltransferase [Altererythrobacter sp. H2]